MAENLDPRVTLDAFIKITISKWRMRLFKLGASRTMKLMRSFTYTISPGRIDAEFNLYGHYVDRGAGRGKSKASGSRQAKKWYYAIFMSQARALERIMAEKFALSVQIYVMESWEQQNQVMVMDGRQNQKQSTNVLFETRKQEFELLRNWSN